jgi:hypothetical protein
VCGFCVFFYGKCWCRQPSLVAEMEKLQRRSQFGGGGASASVVEMAWFSASHPSRDGLV